jgi:phenylpropionate dioxygenase-like ring-hydroxylating dioxygenase large terminal subunit
MTQSSSSGTTLPRDCWYVIALSSAIRNKPVSIPFEDGELVVTRNSAGTVAVRNARCAHRGCSLSSGWIQNDQLTCPYHGWRYDDGGQCRHIPSLRPEESIPAQARVKAYPAAEANGMVWAWIPGEHSQPTYAIETIPEVERTDMVHQPDADINYVFQTHFTRGIENGIDATHAPFLHGKSIGSVDPKADFSLPSYDVEISKSGRSFRARMPIKVKKIRGPAQLLLKGDSNNAFKEYRFIYPNLLLSLVNFGRFTMVSLQAYVPTGGSSTLMLCANYRNFLRNKPLLTDWFNRVTVKTGGKIALEDDEVIKTQNPPAVTFKGSNEILIESDLILIEFRKMMRKFMNTATERQRP